MFLTRVQIRRKKRAGIDCIFQAVAEPHFENKLSLWFGNFPAMLSEFDLYINVSRKRVKIITIICYTTQSVNILS